MRSLKRSCRSRNSLMILDRRKGSWQTFLLKGVCVPRNTARAPAWTDEAAYRRARPIYAPASIRMPRAKTGADNQQRQPRRHWDRRPAACWLGREAAERLERTGKVVGGFQVGEVYPKLIITRLGRVDIVGFPNWIISDSYVDAPLARAFCRDGFDRLLSYVRPVCAAL